jgi:uncharacterized protein (TIGR03000 family)
MYSVVILTAMTTTAEAPAFGDIWAKKCFWECCWPARYGWVPCGGGLPFYPTPYYGCAGGHHHYHTCYGCGAYYGCAGWGYSRGLGHGCAGWGYGCWSPSYACYGGGMIYVGVGYAGFGAYGNYGMYGSVPYIGAPAFAPPIVNIQPANTSTQLESKPLPSPKPLVDNSLPGAAASILVNVPAEARVFVDDYQMKSTSGERRFTTPELEPGRSYFYTIRVVVEKDGKTIEESKRVIVRAGETSHLAFDSLKNPRDDERVIVDAKP